MSKPIVALIYDFDKTLCTKDMQEYGFIPQMGMQPADFWREVGKLTDEQEMDSILAYMYMMVEKARQNKVVVNKEIFVKLGDGIEYFEGVESWFELINQYADSVGVEVEHYIVSSGIKEIIEGTSIANKFKKIYACEFMYDYNGLISWPKFAVNYTTKTQFLFRINKGILKIDSNSAVELNAYQPEDERRIPFKNMIYVGDGLTDVPCMKLVNVNGGQSIAVYDREKGDEGAKELLANNRVNFIAPAEYGEDSDMHKIVKLAIDKINSVHKLEVFSK